MILIDNAGANNWKRGQKKEVSREANAIFALDGEKTILVDVLVYTIRVMVMVMCFPRFIRSEKNVLNSFFAYINGGENQINRLREKSERF